MTLPSPRLRTGALPVLAAALMVAAGPVVHLAVTDAGLSVHAAQLPGLPRAHGSTEAHAVNTAGTIAGAAITRAWARAPSSGWTARWSASTAAAGCARTPPAR